MYALVDCNNFYVSCERVFNLKARGRPVVVLSNNDGCVIARSNEVKALGIKMGVPYFQVRDMIDKHNIAVFSSNYTLYGNMSGRVMAMLSTFVDKMEVYSIDEAFLDLTGMQWNGLREFGLEVVGKTSKGTGIPLSMGIAPTKTLAKVANRFAKKFPAYQGVCVIDSESKRKKALEMTDVADVWGVGWRHARRLRVRGVNTAWEFASLPAAWVRKEMSVVGERMWNELNGTPCIGMELTAPAKKQICTSRAFGQMITGYEELADAVSTYAGICARKLREQGSCATAVQVFIHTNNFIKFHPQYHKNIVIGLPVPTDSTLEISKYALEGLRRIYREGFRYKKAGVIITGIVDGEAVQGNMFYGIDHEKHRRLMAVIDKVNSGFNHNLITLGVQTRDRKWKLQRSLLSPSFTTEIDQIFVVNAS